MSSSGSFRVKKRVGDPLRCRSRLRIPTNIDADYFVHVELGETQVLRKITLQPGCKSSSRACLDLISGSRLRHRIVFVQNIRNGQPMMSLMFLMCHFTAHAFLVPLSYSWAAPPRISHLTSYVGRESLIAATTITTKVDAAFSVILTKGWARRFDS